MLPSAVGGVAAHAAMTPEEQKPQGQQPGANMQPPMQPAPAVQAPAGYPGAPPPMQPQHGQPYYMQGPPQGYIAQPVVATYHPPPTMTLGQALSPEELKKIRKMTWVNFAFTMLQVCMLAHPQNRLQGAAPAYNHRNSVKIKIKNHPII